MTREDLGNLIADYIVDTAEEFASAIDWRIENDALDYAEHRLNQHGWFKERTCSVEGVNDNFYIEYRLSCGHVAIEDKPNYCPNCGAKVVE